MRRALTLLFSLGWLSLACNFGAALQPTPVPATATNTTVPTPAFTNTPESTPIPIVGTDIYSTFHSPADTVWMLDPASPFQRNLPFSLGQYYDYAPASDTVLYATKFADHGAGPGNLAVSDLYTLQIDSGVTTPIIPDENVIEALWMPNGVDILYALATETTHELRLRLAGGDDQLLAQDIAPTFAPSPAGNYVAFTRETGYEVPGPPGVFVVDVASATQVMVSDLDRAGSGSIDDQPAWSWDENYVLMVHLSGPDSTPVLARADGSHTGNISFAEHLEGEAWYAPLFTYPYWAPDNRHVLAMGATAASLDHAMGGPGYLIWIEIDPETFTVVDGQAIGEAMAILGWQVPGESFWALSSEGSEPVLMEIP